MALWRNGGYCRACRAEWLDRRREQLASVRLRRLQIRWPAGLPVVWVPTIAYVAMTQAALRAQGRRDNLNERVREAKLEARTFFSEARFHAEHVWQRCPVCHRWAMVWYASRRGWACKRCADQPRQTELERWLGQYLCAVKMGLHGLKMKKRRTALLHLMQREIRRPRIEGMVALAQASQALRLMVHRHSLPGRRLIPALRPPYGPVWHRLSSSHTLAVWAAQVGPQAFWRRNVIERR